MKLAMLLLIVAASVGCTTHSPRLPDGPAPWERPDVKRPVVDGNQQGLELRIWVIEDQDELVADLINTYQSRPTPMLDSDRSAWRASGLMPVTIPIDELTLARGRMKLIGPEQQDWFGVLADWRETVPGRRVAEGSLISLADGQMRTPAGRFRMLTRCWVEPGADGPVMHIELAVQLQDLNRRPTAVDLAIHGAPSLVEQGLVFPELTTSFQMQKDEALVIVPVSPSFDPAELLIDEEAEPVAPEEGPPITAMPTIGEAMLTSVEFGGVSPVRRRAIIVLIARLPTEYRLLSSREERP
ncbi:MAG: hypothetical protein COB69_03550 [Phycisphaera sp.]|nr:MAG: hypothetical protein COB69_03550 [Phycisphaera sp.]